MLGVSERRCTPVIIGEEPIRELVMAASAVLIPEGVLRPPFAQRGKRFPRSFPQVGEPPFAAQYILAYV